MVFAGFECILKETSQAQIVDESKLQSFVDQTLSHICPGIWILLQGDLGAGKTTLVKQLVLSFANIDDVTSPTFPILNVLDLPYCKNPSIKNFVHLDLYRLKNARELLYLGIENQVTTDSVILLEWSEVIDDNEWVTFFEVTRCQPPCKILEIHISHIAEQTAQREYTLNLFEPIFCHS